MTTVAEGTRTYVKFSIWLLAIDWIVFGSIILIITVGIMGVVR